MALEALQAYGGAAVVVVGEWDGDTGDAAFERELQGAWTLQRSLALPNWSDTAHDLTVWTRQAPDVPPQPCAWPRCLQSNATQAETLAAQQRGLRRSRYCRGLLYKSAAAFTAHQAEFEATLAMHFVFFKRKLDFDSDVDFETVGGAAAGEA